MFSIGQNLKHVHMSYFLLTFDLLLINSSKYLLFGVYISRHHRNTVYKYKLQRKSIMNEIQTDTLFHFCLILMLKNPGFFSCRVKILYQQLLIFLSFITLVYIVSLFHEHIFKSNKAAISQKCEPQSRPNNFFFSSPLR